MNFPQTGRQLARHIRAMLLNNAPGYWDIATQVENEEPENYTFQITTDGGKTFDVTVTEIC